MNRPVLDPPSRPAQVASTTPAGLAGRWRASWKSDYVRKVGETYVAQVIRIGFALAVTVLAARLLGPQARGLYAVAVAIGALGVQFGHFGLHTSNTYFIAKNPACAPALMGNTLAVSWGLGSFIAVATGIVLAVYPDLVRLPSHALILSLVWIPFGLSYLLMQNLLLGMHQVRMYNLIEVVNKAIPLLLIGLLVMAHRVSLAGLFAATLVALCISFVWIFAVIQRNIGRGPQLSLPLFRDNLRYGIKAYLAALFCFLVLRADLFLVQHMLGAEQAGYYSIASAMADYVALFAGVMGTILYPKLSAIPDIGTKLRLTRKATVGAALALLPMVVAASLLAHPLVRILFGPEFAPASLSFILLMPGTFFLGVHMVSVQFLNSIGYPFSVVLIWGASCLLNIGINLLAIPKYGIAGAAVVSSICYCLACVLVLALIRGHARQAVARS